MISSESNDGALLICGSTSYSVNQNEFLLNKGSLSKVINVKIDMDTETAVLTVVLISKKIYDLKQGRTMNVSKNM